MPRRARMYISGLPYHVVQRGNNREACFLEPENYQFYLELWQQMSQRYGVQVHAYCLMTNHIHFLATPEKSCSLSNTLKVVGSRYAYYFNKNYGRSGTLWEGRHKSSLVQTNRYLLTCYRYIEMNPVRAEMVKRPEEYKWSSYGVNAWGDTGWISPHDEYLALGKERHDRLCAYRALFQTELSEFDLNEVRKSVHYCQPFGDDRFKLQIESKYGIKLGQTKRGRPKLESC
jgi:putative transposase